MLAVQNHSQLESFRDPSYFQKPNESTQSSTLDTNSIKEILRGIWADVLDEDQSDFEDEDVFFEVGGNSIKAQNLVTEAKNHGIGLTLKSVFQSPALEEMAEVAVVQTEQTSSHEEMSKSDTHASLFDDDEDQQKAVHEIADICNVDVQHVETVYGCTPMQEALMADDEDNVNAYVRQVVFKLGDNNSVNQLKSAWQETIRSNPVLRTRICSLRKRRGYVQAVLDEVSQWATVNMDLQRFLEQDASTKMSFGDPLFRYTVVEDLNEEGNISKCFIWTVHHALCDGATLPEILDEVSRRYLGKPVAEREPFKKFIESDAIHTDPEEEKDFWQESLSGVNPTSYPPPSQDPNFRPNPKNILEHNLSFDRRAPFGLTKALLLRAAWAVLVSSYTGTEDVSFGAISDGRHVDVPGISRMTGPTINVVPVALTVHAKESVASFLSRVRLQASEMLSFEHSGISRIRRYLADQGSSAADFQTLFVVHPQDFPDAVAPSSASMDLEYLDKIGKKERYNFPLVVTFVLSKDKEVMIRVQYDDEVLQPQQIQNMVHQYQTILSQLCKASKDTLLESISPFSSHDMAQIREWNKHSPPSEQACVHHLFLKQVSNHPDAVAIDSPKCRLTYEKVDQYSSALAAKLLDHGVGPEKFVGVCFEKSPWTAVAIMAVFKAGGVYVPLEPTHPKGRLEEIVRSTEMEVALASTFGSKALSFLKIPTIEVDGPPIKSSPSYLPDKVQHFNTAYLLFTSGTTGKPKGILIPHAAICTSILHHGAAFGAGTHWRTLQFGAHTFDISVAEFLTTLCYGGCLCVPSENDRMNDLAGAITNLNANTLLVVPTVANLLRPQDVPSLQTIVLGGEPVSRETIARWADHVDLTAGYGPSECAVYSAGNLRVLSNAHPADIGHSIGGVQWLVNPENYHELSAIGCVGEIAISGPIVGNGYFKDEATTSSAFVPAPQWLQDIHASCRTLYRTGDLARQNPDGSFRIVGRRDTQVKLRGYRIELGEIENQLMSHDATKAALAALPQKGPCAKQIVAVLSLSQTKLSNSQGSSISPAENLHAPKTRELLSEIERHVGQNLTEYMVPTVWVVVQEMPVLVSGKIDRKAIKSWLDNMSNEDFRFIVGEDDDDDDDTMELEAGSLGDTVRKLWSDVLNVPVDRIGWKTSFFSIGGDSLAAIQIVSEAKQQGLLLSVRNIIDSKSLSNLMPLVKKVEATNPGGIGSKETKWWPDDLISPYQTKLTARLEGRPAVKVVEAYPLSPFQREILAQRKADKGMFLLSWQMELFSRTSEEISMDRLVKGWQRAVQKYPVLRTIFFNDDSSGNPPIQVVLENAHSEVTVTTATAQQGDVEPTFATTKTPHVDDSFLPHRALFCRYGDRIFANIELDHRLIDGWSLRLVKEAILEGYEAEEPYRPQEPPAYKAVIAAQTPSRVADDSRHWSEALRNQSPSLLSLPCTQKERSSLKSRIYLPEIDVEAVNAFSVHHGITSASIFDAAWAQTLSAYTGSSDVSFEYVTSGRDEDVPGVFDIIGVLINVVPFHMQNVTSEHSAEALAALAQRMQQQRAQDSAHTAANIREVIQNELATPKPFNTALNFQRRPTAVERETIMIDDHLKKSNDPWHFDLLVRILHITDDATLRPSLEFYSHVFDEAKMNDVAQDFFKRVQHAIS